jgi:hypothetical protein
MALSIVYSSNHVVNNVAFARHSKLKDAIEIVLPSNLALLM